MNISEATIISEYENEVVDDRRLFIDSDINEDVVTTIVYQILRYNRLDKGLPVNERTPIIVYINTFGGNMTDGFALIDVIMNSKTPVYTVNIGMAYSAGFLVFISGHKRFSMEHASFLMHDGSLQIESTMSKLNDRIQFEMLQSHSKYEHYITKKTNITHEMYNQNLRREWYFYPEEGKDLGVVDYIVGIDCDIEEIL